MEHVALLDRTDTKYVMRVSQLCYLLEQMPGQYRVLHINRSSLNHYQTLYFDTHDFGLYQQHHNGLRARYKVRVREYVDSDLAYWEVKRKTNQGRTVKSRLKAPALDANMDQQAADFISTYTPLDARALEPKLWNRFLRVTLVSKERPERLTVDLNLEFGWGDVYAALTGLVVVEVKQARTSSRSDSVYQMRRMGIQASSFSKYCAGVYLLYDGIKINNFKSQMHLVNKLIQEEVAHEYAR